MPRNFGIRQVAREYWNEGDPAREVSWPYFVIGGALLVLVAIGIFIA